MGHALPAAEILMGRLFETIRRLVADGRYAVGQHASERLDERDILEWQVVSGLEDGELLAEMPDAVPHPKVEVSELLPDGTEVKAVWSHLRRSPPKRRGEARDSALLRRGFAVQIEGKRIKRTRLVRTERFVVAIEVEMVIPLDDPSEPCYEAETVQFLKDVEEHAERGDLDWLRRHGKVYEAVDVA